VATPAEIAAKLTYRAAMIDEEKVKDVVPKPTPAARTEVAVDRRQAHVAVPAPQANVLGEDCTQEPDASPI
jgi:hypothetical protein